MVSCAKAAEGCICQHPPSVAARPGRVTAAPGPLLWLPPSPLHGEGSACHIWAGVLRGQPIGEHPKQNLTHQGSAHCGVGPLPIGTLRGLIIL